jgi:hypothetical protein
MPHSTRVASFGDMSPGDDADFQTAIKVLASRPRRERDAIANFIFWWFGLSKTTRAVLAKIVRPEMTNEAIAKLVGVNRKTVGDWPEFQRCLPDKTEHKHIRQKPSKWRRTMGGGRWPLDHPDNG